jgi:Rrf2 family protein
MKFSTKRRYGTRALLEIAKNYKVRPTKRKEICRSQKISGSYLENILIALKSAGIIETLRGAGGGYALARPPAEINLLDVVIALEGSQAPVECLEKQGLCERSGKCVAQDVWQKVQAAQDKILRATTLAELVQREKHINKDDYAI